MCSRVEGLLSEVAGGDTMDDTGVDVVACGVGEAS